MLPALQTLAWLACVIYSTIPAFWLLIHSRAEHWRALQVSPYRVLIPVWVAMWIATALLTTPWRHDRLYATPWAWLPAAAWFAAGFWLYKQSSANFSTKQLAGLPELRSDHTDQRLVTIGIRARVRHPVYLGHLCELFAWSLGSGLVICYALTTFAMAIGVFMIRQEDTELEHRFGDSYRSYRNSVPGLFPKL